METKKILGKRKTDEKNPGKNHYTNNAAVRMQRNQAEKQRRDRLNDQIAQLATLVPPAVNATKPLDKVSILRLSASWMRLNFSCLNAKRFKSAVVNYLDMHHSLVTNLDIIEKSINGFIIATTFSGVVLMCSRYSEEYIGYQNIDLLGHHISNFVLPKEKDLLLKKMRNLISKYKNGSTNPRNMVRVRMQQRPLPRSNEMRYRKMSFSLSIHSGEDNPQNAVIPKKNLKIGRQKDFGEKAVILIFAEPVQLEPDIDVQYLEQKDCYFTIHGTQGEIIFADHRISIMTGYMPRDVLGNSAYQYIHCSDVPIALFAQKAMFESSDGTGMITYRLRIRDSSYIFLQTKGQIRYKDSTKEVRQFICCNILLSEEEGNRELKKFQERYAPQLKASKMTLKEIKSSTKSTVQANVESCATREIRSNLVEQKCQKQKSVLPVTSVSSPDAPIDMEVPSTVKNRKDRSVYLNLKKNNYKGDSKRNHSLSSSSVDDSPICSMNNTFSDDSLALQVMNCNKVVSPEALSCNVLCNGKLSSFGHSPIQSMSSPNDDTVSYAAPVIQENDSFPVFVNPSFLTTDLLLIPEDYTSYDAENSFFQSQNCTSSEVNCMQNPLQENIGSFNVTDNIEMVPGDLSIPPDAFPNYATANSESLTNPDKTFTGLENGHASRNHFPPFTQEITYAGNSQSALSSRVESAANKSILDNNSESNIDLSFLDHSVDNMALLSDLSDFYENSMLFQKANHDNQFQTETAITGAKFNCDFGVLNDTNGIGELELFTQTSSDLHISNNAHSSLKSNSCSLDSYLTSGNDIPVEGCRIQRRPTNEDYFQTREWQLKKATIYNNSTKQKINDHIYSQFQTNAAINNGDRVYKVSRRGLNHLHPSMNAQSGVHLAQNGCVVMNDLDNQPNSSLYSSFQESNFKSLK